MTAPLVITGQSGAYTLTEADSGRVVEMNLAVAGEITVPANASTTIPVGTQIIVVQIGEGAVSVHGASGVTLRARLGTVLAGRWAVCSLIKRATNEWLVVGDLRP
jgi:butyrate kinase